MAVIVLVALGQPVPAEIVLALLGVFSGLESIGGICVGCLVFNTLVRAELIPESICAECAHLLAPGDVTR